MGRRKEEWKDGEKEERVGRMGRRKGGKREEFFFFSYKSAFYNYALLRLNDMSLYV